MTFRQDLARWLVGGTSSEVTVIPEKAMTGAGAYVLEYHQQMDTLMRDPVKFFEQAQALSRMNPWVNTAERIIVSRAVTLDWHLEDDDQNTEGEELKEPYVTIQRMLEKPSPLVTRRELWSRTLRHMGVCGNGFWYLDELDPQGIATAFFYINPARMTPAEDAKGNLVGWVLDAKADFRWGRGVPLALDEVLHFKLDPPDWGHYGVGILEAFERKARLTSAADTYLTQTLTSGGRRGHFISPPDDSRGPMPDDVYDALVSGLRNVSDSPDATKRNIVTKSPLKITPQAMSPSEVGASAIMASSRDDIFAGWGIPPSQAALQVPAGLNSGDTKSYDEAVLWQGAIIPRMAAFVETLQSYLDRYPVAVEIVVEYPEFDDETPMYELAVKALAQPLTENERRAILKKDPIPDLDAKGEPLGAAIYRPTGYEIVGAVDENGKAVAIPDKPIPPQLAPFTGVPASEAAPTAPETGDDTPVKASGGREFLGLRKSIDTKWVKKTQTSVGEALAAQKEAAVRKVKASSSAALKRHMKDGHYWVPTSSDERMLAALAPHAEAVAKTVVLRAGSLLKPKKADFSDTVLRFIAARVGARVKGINDTTRDLIAIAIAQGVDEGLSPLEVGERIEALTAFDEARAEMIARTEMAQVYNDAAIQSYREYGVSEVEAIDGDEDEECADRNGRTFSLEEAEGITDHPNGTLDWIPIMSENVGKAELELDRIGQLVEAIKAMVDLVGSRPTEVHIHPQGFTVEPTVVNVPSTIVNVPEPVIHMAEQRTIVKTFDRDKEGRIVSVTETPEGAN